MMSRMELLDYNERDDLLDVESVEAWGEARDLGLDVDGSGLALLGEDDGALDILVVGTENANSLDGHIDVLV